MNDFLDGVKNFIAFWTVKHITVLVFVAVCLVLVCQPHQTDDGAPVGQTCNEASCLFPRKDAQAQTETIAQENWSFVLNGSWEDHEPSIPEIRTFRYNPDIGCAVILIKEVTDDMSTESYSAETLSAFRGRGIGVNTVRLVKIGADRAFYLEGLMHNKDVMKSWNLTKAGFGYSLNCFCHSDKDVCQEIANSLEIK